MFSFCATFTAWIPFWAHINIAKVLVQQTSLHCVAVMRKFSCCYNRAVADFWNSVYADENLLTRKIDPLFKFIQLFLKARFWTILVAFR